MSVPDTIVCLKVVPRPEEVRIDPETLTLDRVNARSVINPSDMNALEMALALKDRYGGTVRLLAMGPPLFDEYLKLALAIGADEAYLLSDRAFGGADTLATSYTLAAGVRKMGHYDLILCGEESSDGATGQVPPGMAEWLGVPQVTYGMEVALIDSRFRLRAKRELRGGHEVLITPLPAVVSVKVGANEPRFIDMARREWANEAEVTVWGIDDLDVDPEMIGLPGSPTVVAGTSEAATRERRRERIEGSPAEQARALVAKIAPYLVARPAAAAPAAAETAPAAAVPDVEANGHDRSEAARVAATSPAPPTATPREIGGRRTSQRVAEGASRETPAPGETAWFGRAELLDADGALVAEVLADLRARPSGGEHRQWGGEIRTESGGGHLPFGGQYTLRLETGGEGAVTEHSAVQSYFRNGLGGEEVDVQGVGEPPF